MPEAVLSYLTANDLMKPVTLSKLNRNIDTLDSSKAEGLDGVTNGMLKNTGPVACKLLLEMFNNVMSGSQVPSDWKLGDVVLILKKPLNTNINNYRPITLISCISKLLTRILAKRLSVVIETEDIVGPEQNGFQSSRSCSDNLFILHTALEVNKSRKLLSHLLFVDLKEAYDRVDTILLAKLRQLNFPTTFVNFLNNYYFQDWISMASGGTRTKQQYQKRGLRQGCNLSSGLLIIYLIEFGRRMRASGIGIRLPGVDLVNILMFADDIIILARSVDTDTERNTGSLVLAL